MRSIGQASVLSESDWKKLESVANQKHRLLWSILRFTAARINEALELRTKDVYKDPIKRIPLDEIVFRQETRKGKVDILAAVKRTAIPHHATFLGWSLNGVDASRDAASLTEVLRFPLRPFKVSECPTATLIFTAALMSRS